MKRKLLLTLLLGILLFSPPAGCAEEDVLDVLYPLLDSMNLTAIRNPYFQESFLSFLRENAVNVAIGKDGMPLFYYSENESFGCTGICDNITFNNYTFGSSSMDGDFPEGTNVIGESLVVGDGDLARSIDMLNAIRQSLMENPEALNDFESELMEQQEGYLERVYREELSDDVWDYALDKIKDEPGLYDSIADSIRKDDLESAVSQLEDYMKENYDIESAYDMSNLFDSIENDRLGTLQSEEFLKNVLERIAEEQGREIDPGDIDGLSELMNSEEFKEALKKAKDAMDENPEAFEHMKSLAEEMLENPETKEVFKDAMKKLMEEGDWDTIKELMDAFNQLDNKKELMETLMEGMAEHMNELMESGMMDEMMEMLSDPAMKEALNEAMSTYMQSFFENIGDWAEEIPVEIPYIVAFIAIAATLLILLKLRI